MDERIIYGFTERKPIKGFPELHWTGKRPYRSTQYFPAQLRERYGEERDGWINKIYWGDNLQVMSHLLKEFRGKINLIYIDPPFDSKAEYKKKIKLRGVTTTSDVSAFEEKQYGDIWTNDEYLQFMYERLILLKELMSDTGNIYLHCDWHKSHYLRIILDEVFGPDNFVNEIAWCYKSGGAGERGYAKKHDTILMYSKTKEFFFNPIKEKSYMFPWSGENPAQTYYKDDKGRYTLVSVKDYWTDIGMIATSSYERQGYPTQKPEALLERIIEASSKPGDIIFDCFMGSGTSQAVAMKLGRRFIGADINLGAIQTTTKRLISLTAELQPIVEEQKQFRLIEGGKKAKLDENEYSTQDSKLTPKVAQKFGHYLDTGSAQDKKENAGIETTATAEVMPYTCFEVYNVNNYEFFRNPIEARELLIEALEIQPFSQSNIWDGELDGRMVKIMPVNRIATKADLEELKANLPYKTFEKRKGENPNQPVERITIVCMGHEPDLKASLEAELSEYKLDIEIVDILRDKTDLQLKRDAEADIAIEDGRLVIRAFYPLNLMQKLSLQKEYVEDWRQLVESVMIDWNYDGAVIQPAVTDVPGKNDIVKGIYDIPEEAGTIKVKITDLLSESLEMEVR